MKKLFLFLGLIALLMVSSVSFASVGIRNNGSYIGVATDLNLNCGSGTNTTITNDGSIYNVECSSVLQSTGVANGGATSLATIDTGIPVSFALVRKAISNLGTTTDPLPNGYPGQVLTLFITSVTGGGTWTVTPTTSTGWKNIIFNTAGQSFTTTYISDTVGWIPGPTGSSASNADPTLTLSST
jgi:hypothetical protein